MKHIKAKATAIAAAASLMVTAPVAMAEGYEIWGSDQSNSVAGVASRGVNGSYLNIWDSADVEAQLAGGPDAMPMGCDGKNTKEAGPCDIHDVFPGKLKEYDDTGKFTGNRLQDLPAFGRLHGMLPDPQHMYMNINMFAPGGGYVGIVKGDTKEAVALFRVTSTNGTGVSRSLHMSFWNADGSALLLANLHGKVLERIDITRNHKGKITSATFNQSASLGVGKNMSIFDGAKAYRGKNAHGKQMLGSVSGSYNMANGFGNLTPAGNCKENGCGDGPDGGRGNTVIVCPIVSDTDKAYVTFGAGGLLVADTTTTPMTIIGEYSNADAANGINGAGCGGIQVGNDMWLNAGASAAGQGATQSTFTMYTLPDNAYAPGYIPNTPAANVVFKDATNTNTIGNTAGVAGPNTSGQLPGTTTRRDAHGMTRTLNGSHIHNIDRIQNNVEVFDTTTMMRTTYDLTSADGQGGGVGPCAAASVMDDAGLPQNDVAPDLMDTTPDGKYLVVALRGPTPVSVTHAAQGSCPGVGIIEVLDNGASGKLVGVLRTTNTLDTAPQSAPGGHPYTGTEHSDVHGAAVRMK